MKHVGWADDGGSPTNIEANHVGLRSSAQPTSSTTLYLTCFLLFVFRKLNTNYSKGFKAIAPKYFCDELKSSDKSSEQLACSTDAIMRESQ